MSFSGFSENRYRGHYPNENKILSSKFYPLGYGYTEEHRKHCMLLCKRCLEGGAPQYLCIHCKRVALYCHCLTFTEFRQLRCCRYLRHRRDLTKQRWNQRIPRLPPFFIYRNIKPSIYKNFLVSSAAELACLWDLAVCVCFGGSRKGTSQLQEQKGSAWLSWVQQGHLSLHATPEHAVEGRRTAALHFVFQSKFI